MLLGEVIVLYCENMDRGVYVRCVRKGKVEFGNTKEGNTLQLLLSVEG
jgi:hypothetical protein